MNNPTRPTSHSNLQLAKDLICFFKSDMHKVPFENQYIVDLLHEKGEGTKVLIPCGNLDAFVQYLSRIVILASAPVPIRLTARNEGRLNFVASKRKNIVLFAQAALDLVDARPTSKSGMSCAATVTEQRG